MPNIILADPPTLPESSRGNVYLPIVATPQVNQAVAFYRLVTADQRQQRPTLGTSSALERAALWKARDIAEHDYWSHRAFDGEMPNDTARRFGCNLPSEYGPGLNGLELLVAGSGDASVMFNALANSPAHRVALFGENDFFRKQTHMGIGMATGGKWGWVWAIFIGVCRE